MQSIHRFPFIEWSHSEWEFFLNQNKISAISIIQNIMLERTKKNVACFYAPTVLTSELLKRFLFFFFCFFYVCVLVFQL